METIQELNRLISNETPVYKLRAEGLNDVLEFLNSHPDILGYTITGNTIIPDVQLQFQSNLSMDEILQILKQIPDSHVMLETLKPLAEYTGDR